jgi:FhaA, N-terminal domain/FHA domain
MRGGDGQGLLGTLAGPMARPLAAVERFFERLLERPAARIFRAPIQPVQLERRIERAMEAERRIGAGTTFVPDRYRVQLNPADLTRFAGYQATLEAELSGAVRARARRRGYTLADAPRVTLHANAGVAAGDIVVTADLRDRLDARPAPEGFRRLGVSTDLEAPGQDVDLGAATSGRVSPDGTAVYAIPSPPVPEIVLLVEVAGQALWAFPIVQSTVTVGRAPDNDLVLADDRVSRHHGRLAVQQGRLVYTDLQSTNGSFVNDGRVEQVVLGLEDVVWIGGCRLTVRSAQEVGWTP